MVHRRYFLLLIFAAGGDSIVECEGDDDPTQIARAHSAPVYRQYTTREEAEQVRGPIVRHAPFTGHFRCTCGERLVFSEESRALSVMPDFRREGGLKIGSCPKCGLIHLTRNQPRA